jgi:DNA-binding transcriptional regulator YhcF (GntR family)
VKWNLDKNRPICPQLCQQLCAWIAAGDYPPNQRLMSVREVALAAGVNPNTVQNAFAQLEQKGVLYSVRGLGWFVSEDTVAAKSLFQELVQEKVAAFFGEMTALGISPEEIKEIVKEWEIHE